MNPGDRKVWIMGWIKEHGAVDVMNSDFVDDYIAVSGAKYRPVCWGACKCRMLGRDLSEMARCGALERWRIGLTGTWQPGFPKWVWCYGVGRAAYLFEGKETINNEGTV